MLKLTNELLASVGATNEAEFPAKLAEKMTALSDTSTITMLINDLAASQKEVATLKAELGKANDQIKVIQDKVASFPTSEQIKSEAKTEASRVTAEALGATGNNPLVKAGKGDSPSAPVIDTFEDAARAEYKAQPEGKRDRVVALRSAINKYPKLYQTWGETNRGQAHINWE